MIIKRHHPWNLGYKEAIELQKKLSKEVVLYDDFKEINKIGGVDVKFKRKSNQVVGAVLIFSFPDLDILEVKTYKMEACYPYIPGLLTFREGPVVEKCFEMIENIPDLVFFDGQGYSHPRRVGLATHMGIILDIPSIGCAKKKLCGDYGKLQESRGSYCFLSENGEIIGAALRTRDRIRPIFTSVGHRIGLKSAIEFTLKVSKFRIPEPTRLAHNYLNEHF